jgi:hypothetical protein
VHTCAFPYGFHLRPLIADRLGLPVTRVPDDAAELVRAARVFDLGGSVRLSHHAPRPRADRDRSGHLEPRRSAHRPDH